MIVRIHGNEILPVCPAHPRNRIVRRTSPGKNLKPLSERQIRVRDQGFHGSFISDFPDDLPRVDPGDPRDAELPHGPGERPHTPEIRRHIIAVPDDKSADGRHERLEIVVIDPVIADQRVSHDDELIRVGRVREDFLVTDR